MVKLGGLMTYRAMSALDEVLKEYDEKLRGMKQESPEYQQIREKRNSLQALLWSMENIAEDKVIESEKDVELEEARRQQEMEPPDRSNPNWKKDALSYIGWFVNDSQPETLAQMEKMYQNMLGMSGETAEEQSEAENLKNVGILTPLGKDAVDAVQIIKNELEQSADVDELRDRIQERLQKGSLNGTVKQEIKAITDVVFSDENMRWYHTLNMEEFFENQEEIAIESCIADTEGYDSVSTDSAFSYVDEKYLNGNGKKYKEFLMRDDYNKDNFRETFFSGQSEGKGSEPFLKGLMQRKHRGR